MTPITNYIVVRETDPNNPPVIPEFGQVTVLDATVYDHYQLYVDNAKYATSTSKTFPELWLPYNKKLDVLGLTVGDNADYSSSLSDSNGDKVEVLIPDTFSGLTVNVYYDHGTGTIDYGRPILTGITIGAGGIGWSNLDDTPDDSWGHLTDSQWGTLPADAGISLKFAITPRLQSGTYKFAIVNYKASDPDFYHDPFITSITVTTRPDEITPFVQWYEDATDTMGIGVEDDGVGTYNVYAGAIGGDQTTINWTPIFTSTDATIKLTGFRDGLENGTRYFLCRKTVNGVEEKNWNWVEVQWIGGIWTGNFPNIIIVPTPPPYDPPVNVTGSLEGTWRDS